MRQGGPGCGFLFHLIGMAIGCDLGQTNLTAKATREQLRSGIFPRARKRWGELERVPRPNPSLIGNSLYPGICLARHRTLALGVGKNGVASNI